MLSRSRDRPKYTSAHRATRAGVLTASREVSRQAVFAPAPQQHARRNDRRNSKPPAGDGGSASTSLIKSISVGTSASSSLFQRSWSHDRRSHLKSQRESLLDRQHSSWQSTARAGTPAVELLHRPSAPTQKPSRGHLEEQRSFSQHDRSPNITESLARRKGARIEPGK